MNLNEQLNRLLNVQGARVVVIADTWLEAQQMFNAFAKQGDKRYTCDGEELKVWSAWYNSAIYFRRTPAMWTEWAGAQWTNIVIATTHPLDSADFQFLLSRLRSPKGYKGFTSVEWTARAT